MGGAASSQKGSAKASQPEPVTEKATIPASISKQQLKSVLKKKPTSPDPAAAQQRAGHNNAISGATGNLESSKKPIRDWQQRTIQMAGMLVLDMYTRTHSMSTTRA